MNQKSSHAELMILHLLAEQPRHGYEIEEIIEQRGMREWTAIGFSSIYYLLNKLEKGDRGRRPLAKSRLVEGPGGPARKVYRITPAGMAALKSGAREALADAEGNYHSFLLGLSNLAVLDRGEALEALKEHWRGLGQRLDRIAGHAEDQQPLPDFVELLFDYSKTTLGARQKWINGLIVRLESGRFDWPEAGQQATD